MGNLPRVPGPVVVGSAAGPTLPLAADVLASYRHLYDQYEEAIDDTGDANLHRSLLASQQAVGDMLAANDDYILNQNTVSYQALLTQIGAVNKGLDALQKQIKKVAGDISLFGDILNGIGTVLTLVPIA